MVDKSKIKVGLIGWGTVGTDVSRILVDKPSLIRKKTGANLELRKIADRNVPCTREGVNIEPGKLTKYPEEVINDPEIDIVVELIGGVEAAKRYILTAIENGKHIVTANKMLLAQHGREIFQAAHDKNVTIRFEASVAGGIPIIRSIREGFPANRMQAVYGIVNGTTNYILTQMSDEGTDFDTALEEAQDAGFAEKDPSADIEGFDPAHKIAILTSLAYGLDIDFEDVYTEGITEITQKDIQYASEFGYAIKLLAISKLSKGKVEVRVHPTMIPMRSMLSNVNGVFNAVYVVGDEVGDSMFYGRGAGGEPTASAVVADIIDTAKDIVSSSPIKPDDYRLTAMPIPYCWQLGQAENIPIRPISECRTKYYIRYVAVDTAGVLAQIAGILGNHNISIASVIQRDQHGPETVYVVMLTHEAVEANMQKAISEIDQLEDIRDKTMLIRIEHWGESNGI